MLSKYQPQHRLVVLRSLLPRTCIMSYCWRCRLDAPASSSPPHRCLYARQRHVTARMVMSNHSTLSPPELQTECFGMGPEVGEKSVSLAAVVRPKQLAERPQINLAGCMDQSSRSRRTTRAAHRTFGISFVHRVIRRFVLQVTAAETSWDCFCLAAFSCLQNEAAEGLGSSAGT